MEDFAGFFDDFADLLKDRLTLEILTPATRDPDTDVPSGPAAVVQVIDQLCSDQDLDARSRAQLIVNGVAGTVPVSRCFTAWFPWPELPAGAQLIVRVNGRLRPLLKQGPPTDSGGQGGVYVLELGAPEGNR